MSSSENVLSSYRRPRSDSSIPEAPKMLRPRGKVVTCSSIARALARNNRVVLNENNFNWTRNTEYKYILFSKSQSSMMTINLSMMQFAHREASRRFLDSHSIVWQPRLSLIIYSTSGITGRPWNFFRNRSIILIGRIS